MIIDEQILEKILTPVPGENPSGEDLRKSLTYDRIKEARREDDLSLSSGVWTREEKRADWGEVIKISTDALQKSKDLQIAVWLSEALLHKHGFAGVKEGLDLSKKLCEKFWPTLYPEIDEDGDPEFRLSPVTWMNEKLFLSLKFIPITGPPASGDSEPYCFANMEKAKAEGGELLEAFEKSLSLTQEPFYAKLHLNVTSALGLLEDLNNFLDEKCGRDSPSLRQFREMLEEIQRFASGKFSAPEPEADPEPLPAEPEPESESESEPGPATGGGPEGRGGLFSWKPGKKEKKKSMKETYKVLSEITDYLLKARPQSPALNLMKHAVSWKDSKSERDEAYEMLSQAADFLSTHEPHSPAPYLVKRAVSWKDKKLGDLLPELIKDDNDLQQIFSLLGLQGKKN